VTSIKSDTKGTGSRVEPRLIGHEKSDHHQTKLAQATLSITLCWLVICLAT